ncbi:MAG: PD-(D/E)XK nuclease family protein, partial [Acidobacteriota bacterium]|nr:PD-(D/E)XK nuclease family protein [Acidobacteriota bacterium]
DINQSIYGFRHARPEIFGAYRDETVSNGKHAAELTWNFRSRGEILRFVGALLNGSEGIEARDLVAGKQFEEKQTPPVEIVKTFDEDKDEAIQREARWIAHRILSLGNEFRDFAVLCRNGESMGPILEEFERSGIPYVCGRRQSFLLSREGLDIRALLRIVANPRDSIALATVLRSPLAGLHDETLLYLRFLGRSLNSGLNMLAFDPSRASAIDPDQLRRVTEFSQRLKRWRADAGIITLDLLISRMLTDCGVNWQPGSVEGDNIEAFLQLARGRGSEGSLLDFLRDLESIEAAVSAESELSDEDSGNRVQVMTAHAAKGLEFPVTIVAGMEKGTRSGPGPVSFTPQFGLGVKWKDAATKDGVEDSWAMKNAEAFKQREEHEANRLLYVAMTRAEDRLILSYSRSKTKPSSWAKQIDDFFDVPQEAGPPEFVEIEANGIRASLLATASDPPPLMARDRGREQAAGIVEIARPHVTGQFDTAVNVTSLTAFSNCPRRYYIERYLGWNAPGPRTAGKSDPEELPAAELGSRVHEVLAGKPGPHPEEALALAAVFQSSELGRRSQAAAHREREWDFIADIDGTLIRGTIDLWFEDAEGLHIVDYKTDAAIKPGAYAPQLALYAAALERAFGKRPASASLHYLKHDVIEPVALDDRSIGDARGLIAQLREAQENLAFEMKQGEHCRACPCFRATCPAPEVA